MSRILAIIGGGGRDRKGCRMDLALWQLMLDDVRARVQADDVLVAGGAAWADHLAVTLFLEQRCAGLELYLPAPLIETTVGWRFAQPPGEIRSAGHVMNYYHHIFTRAIGLSSWSQIAQAQQQGAQVEAEPVAAGMVAMFRKNRKIAARCDSVLAYTSDVGDAPTTVGSAFDIWTLTQRDRDRAHVNLQKLRDPAAVPVPDPRRDVARFRNNWNRRHTLSGGG